MQRATAGVIALFVFATFALQVAINLEPGVSPLVTVARMFRFFTIWTNFAAGLAMARIALGGSIPVRLHFALATAISLVALVYHLLLSADHHPVGLDVLTNQMFHTVIPLATVLWWLLDGTHPTIAARSVPIVLVAPLIYTGFALTYGAFSGFYAYFFFNLPMLGWPALLLYNTGLALLFLAMGAVLLALRGRLSQRLQRPRLSTR